MIPHARRAMNAAKTHRIYSCEWRRRWACLSASTRLQIHVPEIFFSHPLVRKLYPHALLILSRDDEQAYS